MVDIQNAAAFHRRGLHGAGFRGTGHTPAAGVFFAIAVICFSSASPTLHRKLTAVPKIEQFLQSVQDSRHMPLGQRVTKGVKQAARLLKSGRHE